MLWVLDTITYIVPPSFKRNKVLCALVPTEGGALVGIAPTFYRPLCLAVRNHPPRCTGFGDGRCTTVNLPAAKNGMFLPGKPPRGVKFRV